MVPYRTISPQGGRGHRRVVEAGDGDGERAAVAAVVADPGKAVDGVLFGGGQRAGGRRLATQL